MTGDRSKAVRAAGAVLTLVPRAKNAVNWRYAAAVAARIFAWGGAPDEAGDDTRSPRRRQTRIVPYGWITVPCLKRSLIRRTLSSESSGFPSSARKLASYESRKAPTLRSGKMV